MPLMAADKLSAPDLVAMAQSHNPGLGAAIAATFDPKDLKEGTAWLGHGQDYFFAVETTSAPQLVIDDASGPMESLPGTDIWYASANLEPVGPLHQFHYVVNGANFGGSLDIPAFGPMAYPQPGVTPGKLTDRIVHTSRIYDGLKSEYWVYTPSQYDPEFPAALMVFQDGAAYIDRNGNVPILNVIDNLIAQKKIPVMICVFINPGDISNAVGKPTYIAAKAHADKWQRTLKDSMRSLEYDTVSDKYARFLRDEILNEVSLKYNIRKDAYSHAITGLSSGGICAFNAAWQMNDYFSRVISWIGSFTSIQWKENAAIQDGGQDYPDKILREPHHNIRVWLQDGSNDLENQSFGDWPMANIRMANSLKTKGYDFHFSFGKGTHNPAHGAAEFADEMTWLWRDFDPDKANQEFTPDPAEKDKPYFRVAIVSRPN
jgi:enterochelin esterase-like enzyme